jgi:hypothetical protein
LLAGLIAWLHIGCTKTPTDINIDTSIYPEVFYAKEGETVTVKGFLDGKGLCIKQSIPSRDNTCETAVFARCPFAYVPARVTYCSKANSTDCIIQLDNVDQYNAAFRGEVFRDNLGTAFSENNAVFISGIVEKVELKPGNVLNVNKIEIIPDSVDPVNIAACTADSSPVP